MIEKFKISYLVLFLASFFLLTNCKSDNKGIESNPAESSQVTNLELDNQDSLMSSAEVKIIDASIVSAEIDSISVKTTTPKEVIKETPASKKEVKKPVQQKPKTTPIKKKPVKIYSSKKPQIQFEELTWNFGEITEGDIIDKKFKFTNTGNAPLEIIATSATCGCTRPSFPFLDIAPGESNVIGVNYNSVGKDGKQHPEVTIESNTNPKITIIKLHGTVKPKPKKEEKPDSLISVKDTLSVKQ